MELCGWQRLSLALEISVHELNPIEIGLIGELVGTCDLNHPICHLAAKEAINLMVFKES